MLQFIELTLKKFKFIFLVSSVVTALLAWLIVLFDDSPKAYTVSEQLFMPPVIGLFGGFATLIGIFFFGYYSFYKKRRTLDRYPYTQFEAELGFKRHFFGKNNLWHFTEEMLVGHYDGFPLEIHPIEESGKKKIGVTVLTEITKSNALNYDQLFAYFEKKGIYFDVGGSSKAFELKKGNTTSLDYIKEELTAFIKSLEAANLKPRELKDAIPR